MLRIFKRDKKEAKTEAIPNISEELAPPTLEKKGFFARLKAGLSKTSHHVGSGLTALVLGKKRIDDDLFETIETQLLLADMGVATTQTILAGLTQKVARKSLDDPAIIIPLLKAEMLAILEPVAKAWDCPASTQPAVILVVGVNGSGKTTSIGKLAHYYGQEGKKMMLAAGDTFRAAATEQLITWGERNHIPVVSQAQGADSASVIFDAFQSAKAKHYDLLLADTAGRLHTQQNLMEELKKIKRVLGKLDPTAPHEVLLVLDASIGQNALNQAKEFHEAIGVTGLVITKLDGTAKGGMVFSIAKHLGLPIRFIGVGEQLSDLQPFSAESFIAALFNEDQTDDRI